MKKNSLVLLLFFPLLLTAQNNNNSSGSLVEFVFKSTACLSKEQREDIGKMLTANAARLQAEGKLIISNNRGAAVLFDWPLRQGNGANDPGYYAISNFVDHNTNYPNQIQDYNCGTRTYDQSGGYNHQGTDIYTWPFWQLKQANNWVEIIAAQAGTIIGKSNGNADNNCSFCSGCNWNAVYIQHADGSVAWYGHMKNNSITVKAVGQTVAKGEYLGVVGSSGNSTGPHLHFEAYKSGTYDLANRIDPFAGSCNSMNGSTSWWATQKPYREPMLNKLMTHSDLPLFGSCPQLEITNEKTVFNPGEVVYYIGYFRDLINGTIPSFKVYRPDNSVAYNWAPVIADDYSSAFWYNAFGLPANAPGGLWKFECTYMGVTNFINFSVNFPTAVKDIVNERGIRLYPNPATDKLYFTSYKTFKGVQVVMENLLGQKILIENKAAFRGGTESISIKNLSSGVYTFSVWEEGKLIYRNKILKQ